MKTVKSKKHNEKDTVDYLNNDNFITIGIFAFIMIYLYIAFYRKVYYPTRQYFKRQNESGYVLLKEGFEHRVLAEKWFGRKLRPEEEVHHINGIRWDNNRYNLAVMTRENHKKWHEGLIGCSPIKCFQKKALKEKN